jgi:amidohydrolase
MPGPAADRDRLPLRLEDAYRDLHAHPELSFAEHRTADLTARWLSGHGYEVTQGIGGTGLTGVLRNGDGPVVLLRADMDGLPVLENTGLPYSSVGRGRDDEGNEVPVMHACGHDVHVTCLMGASALLAEDRPSWQGTLVVLFQPAEELGKGASAMVDDGLYDRVPRPDVVMGQHVAPIPAGLIGLREGPAFASGDSLRIIMYGLGGHGSRPEATVDPVVMAAATVMRLQTLVSREVAGTDMAVVTVGALRAGTKSNIIPDRAELLVNIRTFEPAVREHVLSGIRRIVEAESRASAAPRDPDIEPMESLPAVINDHEAVTRTRPALEAVVGAGRVVDPGPVTGSEDVGLLAAAANAPCVFWLLGGADPAPFASARDVADIRAVMSGIPSNHSPAYAPMIRPTLRIGVEALLTAARTWLQPDQHKPR